MRILVVEDDVLVQRSLLRLINRLYSSETRVDAVLVAEHKEDPADPIVGYDYLRFELETQAGKLTVMPSGNWLACRFEDPDRAAAFLRARGGGALYSLNTYSGKWNFHYFGADFQYALDAVRDLLDCVTAKEKTS